MDQIIPIHFRHQKINFFDSLFNLCLNHITFNLNTICSDTPEGLMLHEGVILPSIICDSLIERYQKINLKISDDFAHLFEDRAKTKLRSVHICNSTITDIGLEYLLHHDLQELSLTNCPNLTYRAYTTNIFKHAANLRWLTIVLPNCIWLENFDATKYLMRLKAPKLKHLELEGIKESLTPLNNRDNMCHELSQLRTLSLSNCLGVSNLDFKKFTNVHTLILFNVPNLQETGSILSICTLKSIVVLDISQSSENREHRQQMFTDVNNTLGLIAKSLPNLRSLDLSGTNLAGERVAQSAYESLSGKRSDIPGLEYRVDNPLDFLGLFRTMHDACRRFHIPAKRISGDATEEQLFNAVASSMGKMEYLHESLLELYILFSEGQMSQTGNFLDVLLEILSKNVHDPKLQWRGCATIYFIVRNRGLPILNEVIERRQIIFNRMLIGMYHTKDQKLIEYSCKSINLIISPKELMFEFKCLAQLLPRIIDGFFVHRKIAKNCAKLLNSIICLANNKQMSELGDAGAIEALVIKLLYYVPRGPEYFLIDTTLCSLVYLTDGHPKNCVRLSEGNRMVRLTTCLKNISDQSIWYMARLILNVAEIRELRPRLMQTNIIQSLLNLLNSNINEIEVSYMAAGIIAYLASDGNEAWTIETPSRNEVLFCMTETIRNWNLEHILSFDLNFKQIVQLARVWHTPHCVYWAVWALANLTLSDPRRFCPLVITEGGADLMCELIQENIFSDNIPPTGFIKFFAQIVYNQCLEHARKV